MSLWLVLPGTLFIIVFSLFIFAVAITAMSDLGGSNDPVDINIYSVGDQLLLKKHLHRLLMLKIMTIMWPLVCLLSIIMLWVGYLKEYGPLYYWWLFLPILFSILLFVVSIGFENSAELAFRPSHYMIGRQYFKCEANRRLEGGIYGKGPMKRFGPYYCRGWVEIEEAEFKLLAMQWHGVKLD